MKIVPTIRRLCVAATLAIAPSPVAVTHVVRLDRNQFAPSELRVAPGDTVRFANGPGGPHNMQFFADSIAPAARAKLDAVMKDKVAPLTSPMFVIEGDTYDVVVPALPDGRYPFHCMPHWTNMHGALVLTRKR